MSATIDHPASMSAATADFKPEEKRVIFASSLGTVFEWYDFYLYATLAPFFAALFFPRATRPRRCCRRLPPTRRVSWCARLVPCCSAASATWWGASTPSS
jgi:hypothetical protein